MDDVPGILVAIEKIQESLSSAEKENKLFDVKVNVFQDAMNCLRTLGRLPKSDILKHENEISKLNENILNLLVLVQLPFQCQLVASKVFCAGNFLLYDSSVAIKKCTDILKVRICNLDLNTSAGLIDSEFLDRNNDVFVMCICLALLELNFKVWSSDIKSNSIILDVIYPLCENVVYKYSAVTLLAFRSLVKSFELLCFLNDSTYLLPDKFVIRTMNIVMSNWENPLTSVREQNSLLFYNFLKLTKKMQWFDCICVDKINYCSELFDLDPLLYMVIYQQSWMTKSKYFLLSGIFSQGDTYKSLLLCKEELLIGLRFSLQYTHLAPAGCDLYNICISRINSDQWKDIFLPMMIDVLASDGNNLMKQNLITFWTRSTLNNHKGAFSLIYDSIKNFEMGNLKSFILLCKVGRREETSMNLDEVDNEKLTICLIHSDENIRSDAFFSLCVSKLMNTVPTCEELKLIKNFLIENVNYDRTSLRQSIINSCTLLFIRFRDSFLSKLKNCNGNMSELIDDTDVRIVMEFIFWFHEFLIGNLEDGCNYQRKYTSLLLYETLLNYLGGNSTTISQRKSNNKNFGVQFKEYAEKINSWNFTSEESKKDLFSCILDQSETVRNTASNILRNFFYFTELDLTLNEISSLYKKGINMCSDKFFYLAESGALLIKTVTILVYKNSNNDRKQLIDEKNQNKMLSELLCGKRNISSELLNIAEKQKIELFKDILEAASNGSPLYSILTAVTELLTDQKSPEFGCLLSDDSEKEKLLTLMENIVKKLVDALSSKSNITDFAPSFADMGEAIETIAQTSTLHCNYNNVDDGEDEEVQLSSAHQLILNCIWLNIKACCTLAGKLVTSSLLESNIKDTIRCVELIRFVLQRCRHKGAIEVAGVSIMQATKYLTSHQNVEFRVIPENILIEIFEIIMASNSGTVSRRSAGLSILVHRIIAGDFSPKKPLLHSCMIRLIEIARKNVSENYNELSDSPQTCAFHFISNLVRDSTLRQEVAHHIHDIAVLCFHNLSSSIWPIRNAALQLFGALLPKLVGQKKHQESDDGNENYAIPIEELYFHMKILFKLMEKQFSVIVFTDDIVATSQLMPSLTLLSNLTVTVHKCINVELRNIIKKFSEYMEELFSSGIYHVRKLSARINCNFCLPYELHDFIKTRINQIMIELKHKNFSKNKLHGLLLNLKFLLSKFCKLKECRLKNYEKEMLYSLREFCSIINCTTIPSFIKVLVSDVLSYYPEIDIKDHSSIFINLIDKGTELCCVGSDNISTDIGFSAWCSSEIQLIFLKNNLDEMKNYVEIFLNSTTVSVNLSCLQCLKLQIRSTQSVNISFFKTVFNKLIHFVVTRNEIEVVYIAFDVLLSIINRLNECDFKRDEYFDEIKLIFDKYIKTFSNYGTKCSGSALPVVCFMINNNFSIHFIKAIVSFIWKWSQPDENDEDLRLSSVESLYQLIPFLKSMNHDDEISVMVWSSVCNILQDENVDIRIEMTKFVTRFYDNKFKSRLKYMNPFLCLCSMHQIDFMIKLMNVKCAISCLWDLLDEKGPLTENEHLTKKLENPFDHGLSNVYKEDIIVINFVFNELSEVVKSEKYQFYLDDIVKSTKFNYENIHKVETNNLTMKKLQYKNKICSKLSCSNLKL